jgi:translation initiation factor IF-1
VDPDREGRAGRRAPVAGAELLGTVSEQLPSGLYRVKLDEGTMVTAHIAGNLDRNFIRLLVGDRVRVQLAPQDSRRGRIVAKVV